MKLSEAITKDELRALSQPSNVKAVWALCVHFAILVGSFAMVILWTNPVTIIVSIFLLAGRQQAVGVISHDCAHSHFFKGKRANAILGHWLIGGAINVPHKVYRDYHLEHHKYAGTDKDPDRWMVNAYPIAKDSFRRKVIRDITGQTGIRDLIREIKTFTWQNNTPWLVFNILLVGILAAVGAVWAYGLWWIAKLFVYPFIYRLRQIGEHGVAIDRDSADDRENTATTLISWWERLFISPNHVNFHLEHHMFAAVPPYNLPKVHKLLKSRGYYDAHDCLTKGFSGVISKAVKA